MKNKSLLLLFISILFFTCKKSDSGKTPITNPTNTTTGTGEVYIKVSECICYGGGSGTYVCASHSIGLGYSSTDLANNAYFQTGTLEKDASDTYHFTLAPGTYYYKATLKNDCYQNECSQCGYANSGTQYLSGAFTVTEGQTLNISVNF